MCVCVCTLNAIYTSGPVTMETTLNRRKVVPAERAKLYLPATLPPQKEKPISIWEWVGSAHRG